MIQPIELYGNYTLKDVVTAINRAIEQINNGGITGKSLADGAVGDRVLAERAVNTQHLGDAVIEQATIGEAAVGNANIDRLTANKVQIVDADVSGTLSASKITVGADSTFDTGYDPSTKETPDGAQDKADAAAAAALATAQAALTSLINSLGDLAYDDLVEAAKLGTTIIDGGYIKSSLLTAANIITGVLNAALVKIQGTDGKLVFENNTITVKDASNNTRVLLGLVSTGAYGLKVAGADGTTILFNETGITGDGIPNGTLTYDKLDTYLQNSVSFVLGGAQVFYQDSAPTGGTYYEGDYWFDTNDSYKAYRYTSSAWVLQSTDSAAYKTGFLVAALIAAGAVTADYITAGTMSANRISGGSLILGGTANGNGVFYLKDAAGNTIGTFDNTGITMTSGSDPADQSIYLIGTATNEAATISPHDFIARNDTESSQTNVMARQIKLMYNIDGLGVPEHQIDINADATPDIQIDGNPVWHDGNKTVSGADGTLITGTPGTSGNLSMWNADGDVVDSGVSTGAFTSFQPTVAGRTTAGTFTYSTRTGVYQKVGKLVTYSFTCIITGASGSPAGLITVTLPSTSKNNANLYWHNTARIIGASWGTGATMCEWLVINNESVATLYGYQNNGAQTNSDASTIGNGDTISGTIIYEEA